jgi:glycosyltransferase involved in cell wall biosynthesis
MDVAQITLGFGGGGGVENFVRDHSLGLSSRGEKILVAASRIDLPGKTLEQGKITDWKGLKIAKVKKYNLPVASIYSFSSNGQKMLRKRKMDVIHAHSLPSPGYLGMKLKESKGVPLVLTLHGAEINVLSNRPAFKQINEMVLSKTDRVVCVSKPLVKRTREIFGIKADYIPNGVDTTRFSPQETEKDIDVIFVGMFREEKGLDVLMKALDGMGKKRPKTMLVGRGPQTQSIREMIKKMGLKKDVSIQGFVRNEKLPQLLNRARVLVLPSRSEGLSLSLLEGMACGVVPVVTDVGGNPTVVRNGKEGVVVPMEDAGALGDGLEQALHDSGKMAKMARNRVVKGFSLDATIDKYTDIYKAVN